MRLRNDPEARNKIEQSKYLISNFPITLNNKTILEIGMGKGEMIAQLAWNNPDFAYIGIEKYPTVALKAINLATKLNLNNFHVICEDVSKLSESFVGKVNEIWLTFSDPWPKKRHYKRRLTYKTFLDIYKSILDVNGVLKVKTDNDNFFEWSIEQIQEYGAHIIYQTTDLHSSPKNNENVQTGYEIKWSSKGKNINYMEVKF